MATTPAATSTNPLTVYISGSSEGKNVDEGEGKGESEGDGEGEGDGGAVEAATVGDGSAQPSAQCM